MSETPKEPPKEWFHNCWNCGTDEEPYFSRILPMGYFCSKCGRAWTDKDGRD